MLGSTHRPFEIEGCGLRVLRTFRFTNSAVSQKHSFGKIEDCHDAHAMLGQPSSSHREGKYERSRGRAGYTCSSYLDQFLVLVLEHLERDLERLLVSHAHALRGWGTNGNKSGSELALEA